MQDEQSKKLVDNLFRRRIFRCLDYRDICESDQYFQKGIFSCNDDAVFVDAGAYIGDTIEEFISFQNNKFHKVYAFEPDEKNYKGIDKSQFDKRVVLMNYGLLDENKECLFLAEGLVGSKIVDHCRSENVVRIQCVKLDEIIKTDERVSWIKMDIEDAELQALQGAENIICKDKPYLSICVYHKPEDIWEIPYYIHSLVPEYKFVLKHHKYQMDETVLYAYI